MFWYCIDNFSFISTPLSDEILRHHEQIEVCCYAIKLYGSNVIVFVNVDYIGVSFDGFLFDRL
jgi:hypothetical protein